MDAITGILGLIWRAWMIVAVPLLAISIVYATWPWGTPFLVVGVCLWLWWRIKVNRLVRQMQNERAAEMRRRKAQYWADWRAGKFRI